MLSQKETNTHAHIHRQRVIRDGRESVRDSVVMVVVASNRDSHINKRNQRENISQSAEPGK